MQCIYFSFTRSGPRNVLPTVFALKLVRRNQKAGNKNTLKKIIATRKKCIAQLQEEALSGHNLRRYNFSPEVIAFRRVRQPTH